jgi:hypothetical protein
MQFYTYAHYKPNGDIFYIGKGQGMRYKSFASGRSKHWHEAAKDGFEPVILARWLSEDEALDHETFLISCFSGKLVNRTTGGQRGTHSPITEETRKKMVLGQRRINERRLTDPDWDIKIRQARSRAAKSRKEGYQKLTGMVFKEKIKTNPQYAQNISIARKKANQQSIIIRREKVAEKVKMVKEMRLIGKSYKEISEITGYSFAMISNILRGKAHA